MYERVARKFQVTLTFARTTDENVVKELGLSSKAPVVLLTKGLDPVPYTQPFDEVTRLTLLDCSSLITALV